MQEMVNLYFMGHISNSSYIVAFGLGHLIKELFSTAVIFGFNATTENELGKAVGAGNMKNVGIYLNRGIFLL
jgi:Na+-driven multidrug efflux pump